MQFLPNSRVKYPNMFVLDFVYYINRNFEMLIKIKEVICKKI